MVFLFLLVVVQPLCPNDYRKIFNKDGQVGTSTSLGYVHGFREQTQYKHRKAKDYILLETYFSNNEG